jgi:hypothetical protein
VIDAKPTAARLDEASARRIAAGRIALIEKRIFATPHGPLPNKPNARAARMTAWLEAGCGDWLLDVYQEGRKTFYVMALPGKPTGWIDVAVYRYNSRSDALEEIAVLARISAHATARLLEHRRDVDLERILREELRGDDVIGLLSFLSANSRRAAEASDEALRFATPHGEFRFKRDSGQILVAATWVRKKPGPPAARGGPG